MTAPLTLAEALAQFDGALPWMRECCSTSDPACLSAGAVRLLLTRLFGGATGYMTDAVQPTVQSCQPSESGPPPEALREAADRMEQAAQRILGRKAMSRAPDVLELREAVEQYLCTRVAPAQEPSEADHADDFRQRLKSEEQAKAMAIIGAIDSPVPPAVLREAQAELEICRDFQREVTAALAKAQRRYEPGAALAAQEAPHA